MSCASSPRESAERPLPPAAIRWADRAASAEAVAAYRADPSPSTLRAAAACERRGTIEYRMARTLHKAWLTADVYDIIPREVEDPALHNMTEEEALSLLEDVLATFPAVAAWVQYRSLRRAINLGWIHMLARLTRLMEVRNQWFTPAGALAHLAETRERDREVRWDCPPTAVEGPWNYPHGRDGGDTMNVQHSIQAWLERDETVDEDVLERALFCNSRQLACAECESFHGGYDAFHCVQHGVGKNVRWHTRRSVCPDCREKEPLVTPVPTERGILRTLTRGVLRRRARLRGVLFCAARLLALYRLDVRWRPGCSGYAEAKARWDAGVASGGR